MLTIKISPATLILQDYLVVRFRDIVEGSSGDAKKGDIVNIVGGKNSISGTATVAFAFEEEGTIGLTLHHDLVISDELRKLAKVLLQFSS